MTVEKLETAEKCIEEMNGHGTVFRCQHSQTKKILYAVFTLAQFIDIFNSPICTKVKLLYNGTTWQL